MLLKQDYYKKKLILKISSFYIIISTDNRRITMNYLKTTLSYFTNNTGNTGGKMFEKYMNQGFPETTLKLSNVEKKEMEKKTFDTLMSMAKDFEGTDVSNMELQGEEKRWLENLLNSFLETNDDDDDDSDSDDDDDETSQKFKKTMEQMRMFKNELWTSDRDGKTSFQEILNGWRELKKNVDEQSAQREAEYPEWMKNQKKVIDELRRGRVTSSYVLGCSKEEQIALLMSEKKYENDVSLFVCYEDAEKFYNDTIFRYQFKKNYVNGMPKKDQIEQLVIKNDMDEEDAEQEYENIIREYLEEKKRCDEMVRSNI